MIWTRRSNFWPGWESDGDVMRLEKAENGSILSM
jgi:hypothetical protein